MDYPSDRSSHAAPAPPPTHIAIVRERLRLTHYSLSTEQSYVGWIHQFIRSDGVDITARWARPRSRPSSPASRWLARSAPPPGAKALAALLSRYREVLGVDLPWLDGVTRAKGQEHVPVLLSRGEIGRPLL